MQVSPVLNNELSFKLQLLIVFSASRFHFNIRALPCQAQDDVLVLLIRRAEASAEIQHQGGCAKNDLLGIAVEMGFHFV